MKSFLREFSVVRHLRPIEVLVQRGDTADLFLTGDTGLDWYFAVVMPAGALGLAGPSDTGMETGEMVDLYSDRFDCKTLSRNFLSPENGGGGG